MRGRSQFSAAQARRIRRLLRDKQVAARPQQKAIRAKLRKGGFYISDFDGSRRGFTVSDFDELVRFGRITIRSSWWQRLMEWFTKRRPQPKRARSSSIEGKSLELHSASSRT